MSQQKNNFIQFRIDNDTKIQFKNYCNNELQKPMSWVFSQCIKKCMNSNQQPSPMNDDDHIDCINNLDYTPTLKNLLKELMKVRYEEYACISDECLMELYQELYQSNQLHLLFEWEHFDGRIRDEWSGDA